MRLVWERCLEYYRANPDSHRYNEIRISMFAGDETAQTTQPKLKGRGAAEGNSSYARPAPSLNFLSLARVPEPRRVRDHQQSGGDGLGKDLERAHREDSCKRNPSAEVGDHADPMRVSFPSPRVGIHVPKHSGPS